MDIARLMIRVPFSFILKEIMKVAINGVEYTLVLREDSYRPVRLVNKKTTLKSSILSSSYSGDSLFIREENFCSKEDDKDFASSTDSFNHTGVVLNTGNEEIKLNDGVGEEDDRSEVEGEDSTTVMASDLRKDKGSALGKDITVFDEALKVAWEAKSKLY